MARFPEIQDFVPGARIASADNPLPPPLSDDELVAAVALAGGQVIIGLKAPGDRRTAETGEVPGISRANALAARASLRAAGLEITQTYRHSSAVVGTVDAERVRVLRQLPVVDYIEPVFSGTLQSQDTTWGLRKLYVPQIWTGGFWGPSVRGQGAFVTILDAGMDEIHRWSGDGPADLYLDCYWIEGMPPADTNCYNQQYGTPGDGHGVHVAGTINGADNGIGWIGVAPNLARFASIKVCDQQGRCPSNWVGSGLDWVLGQTAPRRIVNMSLGFCEDYYFIREWVRKLDSAGVVMVASAGNYVPGAPYGFYCGSQRNDLPNWQNSVMYPARYSQVIAVSGTTPTDAFAVPPAPGAPTHGGGTDTGGGCDGDLQCGTTANTCSGGSRWGTEVDIAAPFWDTSMVRIGAYSVKCGTSMSAAFLSGAAALVWSRFPTYTAAQVRQRLLSTAVPLSPAYQFGSGRLNAFNAVYGYASPPPPLSGYISGPSSIMQKGTYTWTAEPSGGVGGYTYQWSVYFVNSGSSWSMGTSQNQSMTVFAGDGQFEMRVTINSGSQSIQVVHTVYECIGGGNCELP